MKRACTILLLFLSGNALFAQQGKVSPHKADTNLTYAKADKFNLPAELERLKFGQTSEGQIKKLFGEPTHESFEHPRGTSYFFRYYYYDSKGIRFGFLRNSLDTLCLCSIRIGCNSTVKVAKSINPCTSTMEELINALGAPTFKSNSFAFAYLTYRTNGKKHLDFMFEFVDSILRDVNINTWK
jgi:hypothetical protein